MKYENLKQILSLVEELEIRQKKLELLQGEKLYVSVLNHPTNTTSIFTIPSNCEQNYSKEATALINHIKSDLKEQIDVIKSSLERL